jgi:hypothetical protein
MTYVGHRARVLVSYCMVFKMYIRSTDSDQLMFTDLLETRVSADQPYCVGWEQFVSVGVKSCSSSQRTQALCVAFWKTSSVLTWICKLLRENVHHSSKATVIVANLDSVKLQNMKWKNKTSETAQYWGHRKECHGLSLSLPSFCLLLYC